MKLTSRVLALAAVVATALLGSGSADAITDGPCTITGDLRTLDHACPTGYEACLSFLRLAPDAASPKPRVIVPQNCPTPNTGVITTDVTGTSASVSARLSYDASDYAVQVVGFDEDTMVLGIVGSSGGLCGVKASVTSGTCLYSNRAASSSTSATGAASVVMAVAAAGAALLLA